MKRLLLGMTSGTLLILFSLICYYFAAVTFDNLNNRPNVPSFARNGEVQSKISAITIGLYVHGTIAFILSTICLVAGLTQMVESWRQMMRNDSNHPWADATACCCGAVGIVGLIAIFAYGNIQINEAYGVFTNTSNNVPDLSYVPAERAAEMKKQMAESRAAVNSTISNIRWTLIRQLFLNLLLPASSLGITLYRMYGVKDG